MKRFLMGVLAGLLLAGSLTLAQRSEWAGPQWEYSVMEITLGNGTEYSGEWILLIDGQRMPRESVKDVSIVDILNAYGMQGWEYIETWGKLRLFKRQKS